MTVIKKEQKTKAKKSVSKMSLKEAKIEIKALSNKNYDLENKLKGANDSITKLAELNREKAIKLSVNKEQYQKEINEIVKRAGEYARQSMKAKKKIKSLKKDRNEWAKMFKTEFKHAEMLEGILLDIKAQIDANHHTNHHDDRDQNLLNKLFSLIDSQVDMS